MSIIRIYTLADPRNGRVLYVGASACSDYQIIKRHAPDFMTDGAKKNKFGGVFTPVVETIDEANTIEEAAFLEEYWYYQFKSWGFKLRNKIRNGGSFYKYKGNARTGTLQVLENLKNNTNVSHNQAA